ncbi:hypothetical protein E2C01_017308 [Portunus trituberculatus]|uniref:Uncharacterized protein n=1 Tax=Portunus trituberculatus TaxID=210409 RepID=A0A5B7DRB1_PORTR|nr:hypothetical protein [Portunus trituberculatus]
MTMEASERDWKKSSSGFPLASSVESARPRKVAKLTRPMMFIARACSCLMSHSDFGGTAGGRGDQDGPASTGAFRNKCMSGEEVVQNAGLVFTPELRRLIMSNALIFNTNLHLP